ncbi:MULTISPECIES: dihydroxyacetone kinase phosphoryl donor subunit DhaM [unclassified Clostridium]|uniref:dihydroxyacetone kinase phosphoryl donor subunit DhaM n=1 Tax=unclassified Clostridium TaxID=2614128 RepID=UPI002906624D|nr:dihydroxyacetone kinase phosphoryl donor subunit DhaM [Clostridium sp.]MDU5106488.1 dihydroxyacetone kinase phosphoryl donor subunit DhaM [Clostridium sp.]
MVSLLIVSHSELLAKGIKELAKEMSGDVVIEAVGGTEDGRLGNDYSKIYEALDKIYTDDGVLILFDLGSSYLTAEMVKEAFEMEGRENVRIADSAMVEGAVISSIEMSLGRSLDEVCEKLLELKINKI